MSIFPVCECIDDAIELAPNLGFYLKPIAKISITVQLPSNKLVDKKSLSNYELINHLETLIKPKKFVSIKIAKITLQFIRIDAELQNKSDILFVLTCLNEKYMKMFDELKIRACEAKLSFPHRHSWACSAEQKHSGQMTDTVHLKHLPTIWFTRHDDRIQETINPSKYLLREVFKTFGEIEQIEISPVETTCPQENSSSSDEKLICFKPNSFFEAYIKYKDYIGFVKAMDTLKGMKLIYKERHKYYSSNIQVDFDKTNHNEATINKKLSKFQISSDTEEKKELFKKSLQERIPQNESSHFIDEKTRKIERRRKREEKRKLREIEKLKAQESEQINFKIKMEEKKLLRAQRNLQSLRLLDELLERIKNIKLEQLKGVSHQTINKSSNKLANNQELPNKSNLEDIEKQLRSRLINKYQKNKNDIQKQKNAFEEKLVENNVPKKDPKISSSNKRNFYSQGRENQQLSRNKYHKEKYYNRPYSNSYFKNKKQQFHNHRNYQKANNRNSHHHHLFHHSHEKLSHSDFMDIHNTYLRYFRKISYGSPTTTSSSERNNSPKSRESSSKTTSSTSS